METSILLNYVFGTAQTTAEPSDSDEPTVTPGGGDDPNAGND